MRILCLCLGNICRSPAAEAVLRTKAVAMSLPVEIDSAGSGNWYEGEPPDPGMQGAVVRLSPGRSARTAADHRGLRPFRPCPRNGRAQPARHRPDGAAGCAARLEGFLDFAGLGGDVPDPWFTGSFDEVLSLIERCADGVPSRFVAD